MSVMSKSAAEDAVERLSPGEANRLLAGYWLSLWQGDELPRVEAFDMAVVKPLLPHLLMVDVVPENSASIRVAGPGIEAVTGANLNGINWIAWAPTRLRNMRMRNLTAVARGGIMVCRRKMTMTIGKDHHNEELVLPFAINGDGMCTVMVYADWRMDAATTPGVPVTFEASAREHKVIVFGDKRKADDLPMAAV
jgi:hypothetical protein